MTEEELEKCLWTAMQRLQITQGKMVIASPRWVGSDMTVIVTDDDEALSTRVETQDVQAHNAHIETALLGWLKRRPHLWPGVQKRSGENILLMEIPLQEDDLRVSAHDRIKLRNTNAPKTH